MDLKTKKSYRVLRGICKSFTHSMKTEWEVPFDGQPAVFCPNHAGAWGPIDMCAHFELRDQIRPWFNEAVSDPKQMPAYVRQDYWWRPGCRLEPLWNAILPYIGAALLPPIMRTVPGIPVYHDARIITTLRKSAQAVAEGYHLVIFPQMPSGWGQHSPGLLKGWLQVAPVVYKKTGAVLKFYPVRIEHKNHRIYVGKPIPYDPSQSIKLQEEQITDYLAGIMNI